MVLIGTCRQRDMEKVTGTFLQTFVANQVTNGGAWKRYANVCRLLPTADSHQLLTGRNLPETTISCDRAITHFNKPVQKTLEHNLRTIHYWWWLLAFIVLLFFDSYMICGSSRQVSLPWLLWKYPHFRHCPSVFLMRERTGKETGLDSSSHLAAKWMFFEISLLK
jgi:hypothetical protein